MQKLAAFRCRRKVAPLVGLLTMGLAGCGGGDLTLPGSQGEQIALAVVGGNGQAGIVGEELPLALVVAVRNGAGTPAVGLKVAFVSTSGAGGFVNDTALTDAAGQATARWSLGTVAGPYTAEARVVLPSDSAPAPVAFQATANPGHPDTLRPVGSTIQAGSRGETLDEPLVVLVVDRFGNPVPDTDVEWNTSSGSGDVSSQTTASASDGTARVTWTLGNRVGVQWATAKVDHGHGDEVTFMATVPF
ncbi:MAG TPA: hypothetical protein VM347_18820 [Nonomuraea sp.]|nr:hypothetical protein [Nonomuraea sp.]